MELGNRDEEEEKKTAFFSRKNYNPRIKQ